MGAVVCECGKVASVCVCVCGTGALTLAYIYIVSLCVCVVWVLLCVCVWFSRIPGVPTVCVSSCRMCSLYRMCSLAYLKSRPGPAPRVFGLLPAKRNGRHRVALELVLIGAKCVCV